MCVEYGGRLLPPVRSGGRVQNGCQEIRKRESQCAPAAGARYLLGKTHWKKHGERPSVRISPRQERAVNKDRPVFIHSRDGFGCGSSEWLPGSKPEQSKRRPKKKYYVLLGYPGAPRYNLYVDWRASPSTRPRPRPCARPFQTRPPIKCTV